MYSIASARSFFVLRCGFPSLEIDKFLPDSGNCGRPITCCQDYHPPPPFPPRLCAAFPGPYLLTFGSFNSYLVLSQCHFNFFARRLPPLAPVTPNIPPSPGPRSSLPRLLFPSSPWRRHFLSPLSGFPRSLLLTKSFCLTWPHPHPPPIRSCFADRLDPP